MMLQLLKSHTLLFATVFTFGISSCSFTQKTSTRLYQKASTNSYDVIVVPGVPFSDGEWSTTMKGRVLWSKHLYDAGITKNVIYSGSAVYTAYTEAEIMALYGRALGIPPEHIFIENEAEHSTENLYYSYKKARAMGFEKIALASDPFQTKMLKRFSEKCFEKEIGLIPIVFDKLEENFDTAKINPTIDHQSVFVEDFIPLTERENFWQRFRGTRGKNLDFSEPL